MKIDPKSIVSNSKNVPNSGQLLIIKWGLSGTLVESFEILRKEERKEKVGRIQVSCRVCFKT